MRNKATQQKTEQVKKKFEGHLAEKHGEKRQMEDIPPETLNMYMGTYFLTMKKADGSNYEPDSLTAVHRALKRFPLGENGESFAPGLFFNQPSASPLRHSLIGDDPNDPTTTPAAPPPSVNAGLFLDSADDVINDLNFNNNGSGAAHNGSSQNLTLLLHILRSLTQAQLEQLYGQIDDNTREELLRLLNPTMHIKSYEQRLMQYAEFKLHKQILLYLPPILVILGTFGNIFSFVILKRRAMLKFSTYFYLMVLAVADTFVLYIGLLRLWIGELTGYDIKDQSDWSCKLTNVIGCTVSDFSVWLIIAVTVERYIVVCFPLRANSFCNTQRARKVSVGLFFVFFLVNLHFFWTVQVVYYSHEGERIPKCDGSDDHRQLVREIWPWVDAMVYSFLPFIIILVLNALIIRQVIIARRYRTELRSGSVYEYEQRRPSHEGSTRLTVMLLTISFAFLLTTLPMNIVNIATAFWNQYADDLILVSKVKLARTITEMLMYINHSMNFFLYCATGQKFRHQLVWLVCYAKCTYRLAWNSGNAQSQATRMESMRANQLRARSENGDMFVTLKNEMYSAVKCSL